MAPERPNAVIAQSGGPTAVINQSLIGCLETLRDSSEVGRVFGARHAVRGMVDDRFIDLTEIDAERLERIACTPSAALGSSRDKPDEAYCGRIIKALGEREIRLFFYIGGNDSSDTCRIINEQADRAGYDLRCFHIPKTIDNDLVCNDHTPGYGSAARFVATAFMGDNLDNRALPGVKINIVMGRHAGFLTAASALGRAHDDDGPHLVYVPERVFEIDSFVADVDRVYSERGRCLIAVSEGVQDAQGVPVSVALRDSADRDQHGNVQLSGTGALGDGLADHLKIKLADTHGAVRVRADTFGYLQRTFYDASPVDRQEARAVGRRAAELALDGRDGASITITRTADDPYAIEIGDVALEKVAGKTRHMPDEFIDDEQRHVTDAFLRYARPLVGELPVFERFA